MLRRFLFVWGTWFSSSVPFLSPLSSSSSLSPLLSSLPLLSSPPLSLVVFFSVLCCRRFLCLVLLLLLLSSVHVLLLLLLTAAVAVAARGSCVFLSGCFSGRFFSHHFCLFSMSFRPLLSRCQVHSSRRVASTWAGHHDDDVVLIGQSSTLLSCASGSRRAANHANCVRCGQTCRWRYQDEAQASASRCARRIPSAEAAANDGSVSRDWNGRDRDAADSERAPSAQLTGHVAPNAVAGAARRSPRHHGGCFDGERHRFPSVLHRRGVCAITPNATFGCWTTCTYHIAWRALAQTRRAGGGRKTTPHHTPASRTKAFFEGARHPAPHMASMLARPQPTRFSHVASVGNGTGRAPVPVSDSNCAPWSCAHCPVSTQKPLNRCAPVGSSADVWRACAPKAAISCTACDDQLTCTRFFFFFSNHGPKSITVEQVFLWVLNLQAPRKRLLGRLHRQPIVVQSRLRKSISVWCLSLFFRLSLSLFVFLFLFLLFLFISSWFSNFFYRWFSQFYVKKTRFS